MLQDIFTVIIRIFTILPILLFVTLFMGKRAIGELPVFDFLIIITLASVTGADIADPNINHIHTVVAIIFMGILQRLSTHLMLRYRRIGRAMTFDPTIVVKDGKLLRDNIKSIRYSVDNILQMLREKGLFDIGDVRLAIVEGNGKLTVLRIKEKTEVLIEDLGIPKKATGLAYPIILEGKVDINALSALNKSLGWLQGEIEKRGITNIKSIFFASVNEEGKIHISLHNESENNNFNH